MRKVLDDLRKSNSIWWSFLADIDAAERADAAKREEPVQELRRKVAELADRYSRYTLPYSAIMVRYIIADLNAIIAAKSGTAENRQATASGPVMHESVWLDGKNVTIEEMLDKAKDVDQWREIKPVIEPAVAEKVYEIAARAVRDAMPDVLEKVADALEHDCEFDDPVDMLNMYAAKLRKEKTPGHAAAVAAVSDAIGKACEAERKERGS